MWLGLWNTYPTVRAICATVNARLSRPSTSTCPLVGLFSPMACLTRVVFPAPFGPRTAITSPGRMAREASCSTSGPSS